MKNIGWINGKTIATMSVVILMLSGTWYSQYYGPIQQTRQLQYKLEVATAEINALNNQNTQAIEKLQNELNETLSKSENLQNEIEILKQNQLKLTQENQDLQEQLNDALEQIETISQDQLQAQAKIEELEQEIAEKEQIIESIERELNQTVKIERVAILVDADIMEIQSNLNQYKIDVETIHPNIKISIYYDNWQDHTEIRAFIQDLYYNNSISGVILVGKLPYALWDFQGDIAPMPHYYEDLDETFLDRNTDGIFDYHSQNNTELEIWTSWLRPDSENVTKSLNEYLVKSHKYYSGNLTYQDKGLIFIDNAWEYRIPKMENAMLEIYPSVTIIGGSGTELTPEDYTNEYEKWYEMTTVWTHSNNDRHGFSNSEELRASEIKTLGGGSKITIIWGCHAANFYKISVDGNILATSYVLDNKFGIASISSTRSMGTVEHEIIMQEMNKGATIGDAYIYWKTYVYSQNIIQLAKSELEIKDVKEFAWGFILMGDPFIQLQKYQSFVTED